MRTTRRLAAIAKTFLLFGMALPLLTSTVSAGVTIYPDWTTFNAAAGPTRLINLSAGPNTSVPIGGVFDLGFSGVCFENVIQYVNTNPNPVLFLYAYPQTNMRVDLPPNTYAVGMDLTVYYLVPGTFTVTLSNGDAFSYPRPSFVPGVTPPPTFFGAVSTSPLTWVNVTYDNTYFIIDTLALSASAGAVSSCPPSVTSPTISALAPSLGILWPPLNEMVPEVVSAITSGGSGAISCKIISVSSNEAIDANSDWSIIGNLALLLRAERSAKGNGRFYTIAVRCTDTANNSTTKTTTVIVPHDQGN